MLQLSLAAEAVHPSDAAYWRTAARTRAAYWYSTSKGHYENLYQYWPRRRRGARPLRAVVSDPSPACNLPRDVPRVDPERASHSTVLPRQRFFRRVVAEASAKGSAAEAEQS